MDFTIIFLVVLALLALQSGLSLVALMLGLIVLILALKNKSLLITGGLGIIVIVVVKFFNIGDDSWLIAGGLGAVLIGYLLSQKDVSAEQPYYPGGGM